jgi:hypothetical protein
MVTINNVTLSWNDIAIAGFGGRVDVLVEDPQLMTAAERSKAYLRSRTRGKHRSFTVTASMFVWRLVFEAVGDFENGVLEDKNWCIRAGRLGPDS